MTTAFSLSIHGSILHHTIYEMVSVVHVYYCIDAMRSPYIR